MWNPQETSLGLNTLNGEVPRIDCCAWTEEMKVLRKCAERSVRAERDSRQTGPDRDQAPGLPVTQGIQHRVPAVTLGPARFLPRKGSREPHLNGSPAIRAPVRPLS